MRLERRGHILIAVPEEGQPPRLAIIDRLDPERIILQLHIPTNPATDSGAKPAGVAAAERSVRFVHRAGIQVESAAIVISSDGDPREILGAPASPPA